MKVKFLRGYPACYVKPLNSLVISDLHLGIEEEYREKGVNIKPVHEKMKETLIELAQKTKANKLIVLGDVKHSIGLATHKEEKFIRSFFLDLKKHFEDIFIVKGNHDGKLENILPKFKIFDQKGFVLDRYYFFHGSSSPDLRAYFCDIIFCGHLQPGIEIKDEMGYARRIRVWVRSKLDKQKIKDVLRLRKLGNLEIIILPAFNSLVGSLVLNRDSIENFFFVLRSFLDLNEAEIYSLDGIYLGKLKHFLSI